MLDQILVQIKDRVANFTNNTSIDNKLLPIVAAIIYITFVAPRIPKSYLDMIESPVIKALILGSIVYAYRIDPLLSLLGAVAFIITMETHNRHKVNVSISSYAKTSLKKLNNNNDDSKSDNESVDEKTLADNKNVPMNIKKMCSNEINTEKAEYDKANELISAGNQILNKADEVITSNQSEGEKLSSIGEGISKLGNELNQVSRERKNNTQQLVDGVNLVLGSQKKKNSEESNYKSKKGLTIINRCNEVSKELNEKTSKILEEVNKLALGNDDDNGNIVVNKEEEEEEEENDSDILIDSIDDAQSKDLLKDDGNGQIEGFDSGFGYADYDQD